MERILRCKRLNTQENHTEYNQAPNRRVSHVHSDTSVFLGFLLDTGNLHRVEILTYGA